MRKYRIKQVGRRFFIEYTELFDWWWRKYEDSLDDKFGHQSLDLAKDRISEIISEQTPIIHNYP